MIDLHIICESLEQRQDVFNSLDKMGLAPIDSHGDFLQVNSSINKRRYMTVVDGDVWPGSEILTYPQFMDKYSMNQLKTKIDEVKAKLGLTQMQLSERIGKNPYYLDTVKHRGVTTERQNELIKELDFISNGGVLVTEREIIKTLTERMDRYFSELEFAKEDLRKSQAANRELSRKLDFAEKQYMELNDAYGRVCEKLAEVNTDLLTHKPYKRQYRDLVATVIVVGIIVVLGLAIWSAV